MIEETLSSIEEKNKIRSLLKEKRKGLSAERRREGAQNLLHALLPLVKSGLILSFASFQDETDLWPLNERLAKQKQLVLPLMLREKLLLYLVKNPKEELHPSSFGILEPCQKRCREILPEQISLALIPGLGFDLEHHRIGYGKGYYDRLLGKLTKVKKIGIGFSEQLVNHPLPIQEHDVRLDQLLLI